MEPRWRDIDISFAQNGQGILLTKTNSSSIKQRLKTLLLLESGDIPFHPEVSSGIRSLAFENFSPAVKITLRQQIENIINNEEPTLEITKLDIEFDEAEHGLYVMGTVKEISMTDPIDFKIFIGRVR